MPTFHYGKNVTNIAKLHKELASLLTTNFVGVSTSPNQVAVDTVNEMTMEERTSVIGALEGFQEFDPLQYTKVRIFQAMDFGRDLIAEFGALNVLKGYSIAQVTQVSIDLQVLQSLCSSGSLYAALEYIENHATTELVSQDDINYFSSKIRTYLGLPPRS